MMKLPDRFCTAMQSLLGEEYEAYMLSYEQPRHYGLRVNTTKISAAQLEQSVPFAMKQIPFISNVYYYQETD